MNTNDEKPQYNEDTYPWYGRVFEWVLLRVIYFVGTFGAGVILFSRGWHRRWYRYYDDLLHPYDYPGFWFGLAIFSLFVALIGPWLYKKYVERDRGKLQEIKAMEREFMPEQEEESDAEYAKRILEEEGK